MSAQTPFLFPACVALENTVPLAKMLWQFTPLGAGVQNPVNCLNETSTLFLLPCIGTRVTLQECVKFLPLIVGDLSRHPTIVAVLTEHNKRQRNLVCVWKLGVTPRSHRPSSNSLALGKSRMQPSMTTPTPPRPWK